MRIIAGMETLYKYIGVIVCYSIIFSLVASLTYFLCSFFWVIVFNLNSQKGDYIRFYLHTNTYETSHLRELYYSAHTKKLHKLLLMYRLRNIRKAN